jgi:hypothetical protein
MLFKYIVIGADSKEKSGKIEAKNQNEAQEKLNGMGFSVVSIDVFNPEEGSNFNSEEQTFLFSGKDIKNQVVEGTIEAIDDIQAYQRLVKEFELDVTWIVNRNWSKSVQDSRKEKSLEKIEEKALEQGILIEKPKNKKESEDDQVFDINFQKKQKALLSRIDEVNEILKDIFSLIQEKNPTKFVEIEKKYEIIQKIKMSNNLLLIEENLDQFIKMVLLFFENNDTLKKEYQTEIINLELNLSNLSQEKVHRFWRKFKLWVDGSFQNFLKFFVNFQKKGSEKKHTEDKKKVVEIKSNINDIKKLLWFHGIRMIISLKLRDKHKKAFLKLLKEYKRNNFDLKKIKEDYLKKQEFLKKQYLIENDFYQTFLKEIEFFSGWFLFIYILFFAILEIALLKSKILSPKLGWEIFNSPLLIALTFFFFFLYFYSIEARKRCFYPLFLIFGYFLILFLSLIFYYNL